MSKHGVQSNGSNDNEKKVMASKPQKGVIAISYRLEGKHLGKASFYDHYTLQRHTGFPTAVLRAKNPEIKTKYLADYISAQTVNLPHSPLDKDLKRPIPVELESQLDGGLLFVPGMTRDSYEKKPYAHQVRVKFEKEVIQDALRRGRPILAVCAGTWTLWEALGGKINTVSDHNYGGGMPRISVTGKMTYNKHIHDVEIKTGTLLHDMMGFGGEVDNKILPANSVHWMAPDDSYIPDNFQISAVSKKNASVSIQTRQQNQMSPDEGTVEGFSSVLGAPIAGFVWHLEAFDWTSHNSADIANNQALLFMAKAGSAYRAKQNMLRDYKDKVQAIQAKDMNALSSVFGKMKI